MITLAELKQRHECSMLSNSDRDKARYELRSFVLAENGNGYSSISPMFITSARGEAVASVPKGVLEDTEAVAKVKKIMRKLSLKDKKRVIIAALYQVSNTGLLAKELKIKEESLRNAASIGLKLYLNESKNLQNNA